MKERKNERKKKKISKEVKMSEVIINTERKKERTKERKNTIFRKRVKKQMPYI